MGKIALKWSPWFKNRQRVGEAAAWRLWESAAGSGSPWEPVPSWRLRGRIWHGVPGEPAAPRRSHAAGSSPGAPRRSWGLQGEVSLLQPLSASRMPRIPRVCRLSLLQPPRPPLGTGIPVHMAADIPDRGAGLVLGCPFGTLCFGGWCRVVQPRRGCFLGGSSSGRVSPSPAPLQVFRAARGTVYSWCLARIFNFQECKAAGEQQGVRAHLPVPPWWDEPDGGSGHDTAAAFAAGTVPWLGAAGP